MRGAGAHHDFAWISNIVVSRPRPLNRQLSLRQLPSTARLLCRLGTWLVSFQFIHYNERGLVFWTPLFTVGIAPTSPESGNDIAAVRVKPRSRVSRRLRRSENPSGQSPRLLALLMCPASPIITNSLPHAVANACARETVTYGSLELATTTLRNGSCRSGIGAKPVGPDGKLGASGSLGATRSAPLIRRVG